MKAQLAALIDALESLVLRLFVVIDKTGLVRRGYLAATFVMTYQTMQWAMRYADVNAARPGTEVAVVIAAVSTVVGAVQAFAFKQYLDSRGESS